MPPSPLRYHPAIERPEPDESDTTLQMIEALRGIAETTFADSGHALRGVHAKGHGLLTGTLVVDDLPPELAQGIFAKPASYPTVVRFSTSPGDVMDDSVSTPRGVALKLCGVPGERLVGSEAARTQDFLMVDSPAFSTSSAKDFLKSLTLLAKTTDKAETLKLALSAALRAGESLLETSGRQSGLLKALGGHPRTNLLGETYFTQTPLRYGDYACKLSLRPSSDTLKALKDADIDHDDFDALRSAVQEFFATQDATWELCAQLRTDADAMPIEDSSRPWPEDLSPYRPIARLVVPRQASWSDDKRRAIDDGMAFSPWHGVVDHRPLGSIMRVRKSIYETSMRFRGARNNCPMHEPGARLPDFMSAERSSP